MMSNQSAQVPAVTVVVPCRNEIDHIETCLRSILEQVPPKGGFEVVVADGMSNDGTRTVLERMAREDARLRVVDNPSQITPCAMNCGIRAAQGAWIARLDAHNRYAHDYLVRCLEVAQTTGADNVGGAMFCEGVGFLQRAIAAAHHSSFSVGGAHWHNPNFEGPTDTVFGGFYKREVFDRIGLFDEALVRNQDCELNLRLVRAGGRIWQSPRIKSWYRPRSSLSALFRQYKQYGYWKVPEIQKHKSPASYRHLVPAAFVLAQGTLALLALFCVVISAILPWSAALGHISAMILAGLGGSYLLALLTASVLTARKNGWALLPFLLVVFPCYHFGYGYGFLRGVWDLVIRRKGAGTQFIQLTRGPLKPAAQD